MSLLTLLSPKRHFFAHAVKKVAEQMPETPLNFSQHPVLPKQLPREITHGTEIGMRFYEDFEAARRLEHKPFFKALHDFEETPPFPSARKGFKPSRDIH
jgi:hypothetical protein